MPNFPSQSLTKRVNLLARELTILATCIRACRKMIKL